MSLFGGSKNSDKDDNLFKQTGRGIVTVGTLIGAGILLGVGIGAVTGD